MKTPIDARSTGRKRARAVLFRNRRPYYCDLRERGCGKGPTELPDSSYSPKDREQYPLASVDNQVEGLILDANHINKDILDNDPANLEWLCRSCHVKADRQTEKGVSVLDDEHGYGNIPEF